MTAPKAETQCSTLPQPVISYAKARQTFCAPPSPPRALLSSRARLRAAAAAAAEEVPWRNLAGKKGYGKGTDVFYPGYEKVFNQIGRERGWSPVTKDHFLMQTGPLGALVVGSPDDVVEKIIRHSNALGGLSRFTFQMNVAALNHQQVLNSIRLIAKDVIPKLNEFFKAN